MTPSAPFHRRLRTVTGVVTLALALGLGSAPDASAQRLTLSQLQEQIDTLRAELEALQVALEVVEVENAQQTSDITALEAQVAAIEQRLASLEAILSPCRGKCAFITSTTHTGNLGGLAGADQICNEQARLAGLSGTYLAWISDDSGSPLGRFFRSPEPYRLRDGTIVANDWNDLVDGTLQHPINLDESGAPINTPQGVWTGTNTAGAHDTPTCANWTNGFASGEGHFGRFPQTDAGWTNPPLLFGDGGQTCNTNLRLYCFQQ